MRQFMPIAAARAAAVARGIRPGQLADPTPCSEYDVRALANHLTYWGLLYSERAARKQPAPDGADRDRVADPDWAEDFARYAERTALAWSEPEAWTGSTTFVGTPMPAELVGSLLLAELVLHGWDLAVATGQELACPAELGSAVLTALTPMADQGRAGGIFAAPVPVPESAPPLHRALGLSGRDPNWSAG